MPRPRTKRGLLEKRPTWTHLVLNTLSEADDFIHELRTPEDAPRSRGRKAR
jgi:hypothetical protein